MIAQEQVTEYVCVSLRYPLRDTEQLISMVCLHFSDLTMGDAHSMVSLALLHFAIRGATGQ